MNDYYDRKQGTHSDGTLVWQRDGDADNEKEVAKLLQDRWGIELKRFGALAPIDWYAEKEARLVGVVEFKDRAHPSSKYPTIFLNVRKWMALLMAAMGLNVKALFVVRFEDGVKWINAYDVDATRHRIGGCARTVPSVSNIEPLIEVPIADMKDLGGQ